MFFSCCRYGSWLQKTAKIFQFSALLDLNSAFRNSFEEMRKDIAFSDRNFCNQAQFHILKLASFGEGLYSFLFYFLLLRVILVGHISFPNLSPQILMIYVLTWISR